MNRTTTVLLTLTVLAVLAPTTARAEDKELRISVWLDKDQRPLWNTQDEKDLKAKGYKKTLLFRKLIVATDAVIYHPGNPGAQGKIVSPLDVFHQLKTDDGKEWVDRAGKRYLRVGSSDGVSKGWLEVAMPTKTEELSPDVTIWGTRLLLDPNQSQKGVERFTVFKDPERKVERAVLRGTANGHRNIAPILRKVGKEKDQFFEVAFFSGQVHSKGKEIANVVAQGIKPENLRLEVMFVIDTTASMTPLLDATKEVVKLCVQELNKQAKLKGAVSFGLIEYQDLVPGLTPAKIVSPLTENLDSFLAKLDPLKVAQVDSEDWPEDVLAGLDMAIDKAGWSQKGAKHIVLIGDASAHLEGRKNTTGLDIERIIVKGRRVGGSELERAIGTKNFHAIRVIGENPADYDRCDKQFGDIAKNGGEFQGIYEKADVNTRNPKEKNDQEVARVVKVLTEKLNQGFKVVAKLRDEDTRQKVINDMEANKDKGEKDEISSPLYQIVEALNGQPKELMTGYAAAISPSGNTVAKIRVYVEKNELDRLRSTLDFLYTQLKGKADPDSRKKLPELVQLLKQAAAGSITGQLIEPNTKFQDLITDLPLNTNALQITAEILSKKDVNAFKTWLKDLESSQKAVKALLDEEKNWIEMKDAVLKDELFAYIRQSDMP